MHGAVPVVELRSWARRERDHAVARQQLLLPGAFAALEVRVRIAQS